MCQIVPYICPPKDLCVLCEFLPLQVAIACVIEKMQLTQQNPPLSHTSNGKVFHKLVLGFEYISLFIFTFLTFSYKTYL